MNTHEDVWTARLHAAVDEHPGAAAFDVSWYVDAGRRRARRRRARAIAAATAPAAVLAAVVAVLAVGTPDEAPESADPAVPSTTALGPSPNGWVAIDASQRGGDIYLLRPGEEARLLDVARSDTTDEACPAWSPDGTKLLFGRVGGSSLTTSGDAELVIVPVGQDGTPGTPAVIGLPGFDVLPGFDAHPCGIWAPDGRWVALAGTGHVWVVDTQTGEIRRLPDLRPSDLEWRPASDELAIAGDMGTDRAARTISTPVTIYSLSTEELHPLGSVEAAHITWSPDGTTLAYTGGETSPRELWLVDSDGAHRRLLVPDTGDNLHGIGPVWSPRGDRIVYQRIIPDGREEHEVVLVNATDGIETVIDPPRTGGMVWYPFTVTWSPDGTTLLYTAWSWTGADATGVLAVPADSPTNVTVLTDAIDLGDVYTYRWAPPQEWGRQPG